MEHGALNGFLYLQFDAPMTTFHVIVVEKSWLQGNKKPLPSNKILLKMNEYIKKEATLKTK